MLKQADFRATFVQSLGLSLGAELACQQSRPFTNKITIGAL